MIDIRTAHHRAEDLVHGWETKEGAMSKKQADKLIAVIEKAMLSLVQETERAVLDALAALSVKIVGYAAKTPKS